MAKYDASYQIRAGLRGIPDHGVEVAEGETAEITSEGAPTVSQIEGVVRPALEAAFPGWFVVVSAERLDV